jgi:hypothetical protein
LWLNAFMACLVIITLMSEQNIQDPNQSNITSEEAHNRLIEEEKKKKTQTTSTTIEEESSK